MHRGRRRRRHAHPARPRHAAAGAGRRRLPVGHAAAADRGADRRGRARRRARRLPARPDGAGRRRHRPHALAPRPLRPRAPRAPGDPGLRQRGHAGDPRGRARLLPGRGAAGRPAPAARPTSRCASAASPVTAIPVDHAAPDSRALLVRGRRAAPALHRRPARPRAHRLPLREAARRRARARRRLAALSRARRWARRAARTACAARPTSRSSSSSSRASEPDKLLAVAASGQNLDRLVSCFRAARRAGRQLVVDAYQAYVLMQLAPLSPNIPQFDWDGVRVKFAPPPGRAPQGGRPHGPRPRDERAGLRRARPSSSPHPGRFLMCVRGQLRRDQALRPVGADRVVLVWSMWSGYWERNGCACASGPSAGVEPHFVHSGGHAWPEDLRRLSRRSRRSRPCGCTPTAGIPARSRSRYCSGNRATRGNRL